MAEAALFGVAKSVLGQLSSPALKEVLLLWNFDKDLNRLEQTIQTITDFLHDAERRESKEQLVKGWLSRLRSILYDADDLFDAVAARALRKQAMSGNTFRKEVRLFFSKSNQLAFVYKTAHNIKAIRERLDDINKNIRPFKFQSLKVEDSFPLMNLNRKTDSFVDVGTVIGRDEERQEIVRLLLSRETGHRKLSVISIIGFGGLGKTTLAQFVYSDPRVQKNFDLCLWACINYFSDLKSVLVKILTPFLDSYPQDLDIKQLQLKLRECIGGKKVLLVVDDVWDDDASNWDKFETLLKCVKIGSMVLATTRNTKVAKSLDAMEPYHHLNVLTPESALSLFVKMAFKDGEFSRDDEWNQMGQQIVRRCGYVPLAIITVGRMLRSRTKEKTLWLSFVDKELQEVLLDDTDNEKVMQVLKLSYNALPTALKYCFSYCSLFPKDYEFDKDEMVCMWLAQGFLEPQRTKSLEEVGDEYFFHLVDRCFFKAVEEYRRDGSIGYKYKMDVLIHDLAVKVAGMECRCFLKGDLDNMVEGTLRHISISNNPNFLFDFNEWSSCSETLRTLLFHDRDRTNPLSSQFSFRALRTLQLSFCNVHKLPNSIGELIHLRYLDLSSNLLLKYLPRSICKLYHLQTLKLKGCECLKELPSNLGKLVSLRHLFLDKCTSLTSLPLGLSALTSLVTLDRLIVHCRNGGLKYLECLDNLSGTVKVELPIEGWPKAKEDARKSNMLMKHRLKGMVINWIRSDASSVHEMAIEERKEVLNILQPHDNLQYLKIEGYVSEKLSSWVFSLLHLTELILYNCTFEYLDDRTRIYDSLFPSLQVLKMDSLPNLRGWRGEPGQKQPCIPSVLEVAITNCPMLQENMPLFSGIEKLKLSGVGEALVTELLTENPHRNSWLKELKLVDIEDLSFVPDGCIQHLTALKTLRITNCSGLNGVSGGGLAHLTALQELEIRDCGNVNLEDEEEQGLGMPWKMLENLRFLVVPWQRHLIEELWCLTALQTLRVDYWENKQIKVDNEGSFRNFLGLRKLEIGFSGTTSCTPTWIRHLIFLKDLEFRDSKQISLDWRPINSLSLSKIVLRNVHNVINDGQWYLSSLVELKIHVSHEAKWIHELPWEFFSCLCIVDLYGIQNLERIPDGIQHLTSLESLSIDNCEKNIKEIPRWMTDLTNLQRLSIICCSSELEMRCKPETGEDWPLISHIPTINICNHDSRAKSQTF